MAKLFSVLFLVISIGSASGPLAAQTRDDVQAVWETSRQPSRSAPAADRRSASIEGAAAAFRQVRVNTSDLIADMRAVDLNKDGIMDIAILDNQNKRVLVYLGDRALAFSKKYKYGLANAGYYFVAVADFDKSGKPDLAVENVTATKPVSIFFGKGNGQLIPAPLHLTSSASVVGWLEFGSAADLDGNGLPDILVQDCSNQLFSFLNQGKKKFTAKNFKPGVGQGFATGDFNGDKKDDGFIYHMWEHKVYFFKGLGDGTFLKMNGYKVEDSFSSCDLYAADFNKDGKLDLLGQGKGFASTGNNWVFMGRGNGTLGNKKFLPGTGSFKYGVAVADIDGDKKLDLAAAEDDGVWFYSGKGTGSFTTATVLGQGLDFGFAGHGVQAVGWGDFNKDGNPDLVGVNTQGTFYNLIFFLGGLTPATLQISNLAVTTLAHTTNQVNFAGSLNYTGTNCVLKRLAGGDDPRKSAFLQFQIKIDLPVNDIYVTYSVTGSFLDGLNPDSGTIAFNLQLPSPVTVISGTPPDLSLLSFYLYDFNLVRSNSLQ